MHSYPDVQLFINGTWRDAIGGETLPVSDPATEEVIGKIAHARPAACCPGRHRGDAGDR